MGVARPAIRGPGDPRLDAGDTHCGSGDLVRCLAARTRYYFSHDDTAVVAVRSTRDGWLLTDYCSAHPGQGEGWWLRQWVLPVVYQAADRAGITVRLTRTPGRIAESCTAETPELRPSGSLRPGRVALARSPHVASA